MLGRSARKNRKRACHWCRPGTQGPRRRPGGLHDDGRRTRVRTTTIRRACRRPSRLPCHGSGSPQQAFWSNRYEECGGGCGTMVFVRMSLHRAALSSRAGRSLGRRRPASVPRRLRPNPKSYFVILNEAKNLFPCEPKAACGLCLARRKKTNEVQSRIYFGQGYRCFAALNMTVGAALRKEANDKRSAVKNLSTYTFIQILRRSSDLLRMTILPLHWSGIDFWSRPGRLRGSHLRCEPAPGARSSVSERERACHNCHVEQSETSDTDSSSLCSSE